MIYDRVTPLSIYFHFPSIILPQPIFHERFAFSRITWKFTLPTLDQDFVGLSIDPHTARPLHKNKVSYTSFVIV